MKEKDCILIWTDSIENTSLMRHGIALANDLDTNYCVMCPSEDKNSYQFISPTQEIFKLSRKKTSSFIFDTKKELGILFIITDVDFSNDESSKNSINKIKTIKRTELGCICLKENYSLDIYKNIITVTGYEKGEKEKVMWANYFSKKLNGKTNLVVPSEKDEYISQHIDNIVYFSQKLLTQTQNKFEFHKSDKTTEKLKKDYSFRMMDTNSLFIVNLQHINMLPFTQAKDIQLIRKSGTTATMIVPETDDSLIPCH